MDYFFQTDFVHSLFSDLMHYLSHVIHYFSLFTYAFVSNASEYRYFYHICLDMIDNVNNDTCRRFGL